MSKLNFCLLLAFACCLTLTGCDSPERRLERLQAEINAFQLAPTPEKEVAIQQSFNEVDAEITDLEAHGKTIKAQMLKDQRDRLMASFNQARLNSAVDQVKSAVQDFGSAVKKAGEAFGESIKKSTNDNP